MALVPVLHPALAAPPESLEELTKRMTLCIHQKNLAPLGLSGNQALDGLDDSHALDKLFVIFVRHLIPNFPDKGNKKLQKLLKVQIGVFFKNVTLQKVQDVADHILVACNPKLVDLEAAPPDEDIPSLNLSTEIRFKKLYEMAPAPSTLTEKLERCQLIMSFLVKEYVFFRNLLILSILYDWVKKTRNDHLIDIISEWRAGK